MPGSGPQTPPRDRLSRARRLKRQRLIRPLFARDAARVNVGTVSVRYRIAPASAVGRATPLQVGFATARRLGGKPERNRLKRRLREAFRVHQHPLVDLFTIRPGTLTLMVVCRARTPAEARRSPADLAAALDRLYLRLVPQDTGA